MIFSDASNRRRGGTRSSRLNRVSQDIISFCESRHLALTAFYVPGAENGEADSQSRQKPDWADWKLKPECFARVFGKWRVDIDLFAARWNAQLPRFVSWIPQPGAFAVDAFSLNWASLSGFAFPPFALIHRCLAKIISEQADVVLITPFWPAQTWFPLILELACDDPIRQPNDPDILVSPEGKAHQLAITGALNLTAWKLSGRN